MHRADIVSHLTRLRQVGRSLESHGKRMETGPPSPALAVCLDTAFGVALGDGTDDATVKTARKQHSIRHVAHHLAFHCRTKTIAYGIAAGGIVLHIVVFHPVTLIPRLHSGVLAPIIVAGQERFIAVALAFKSLQLTCHENFSVVIISYIKRNDSDMVAGYEEGILLLVIKGKGENAVQVFKKVKSLVAVKRKDHLTVATCLKIITSLISCPDLLMVIYLAVDGQHLFAIRREQRLVSTLGIDDAQTLMRQYGTARTMYAAPVWTTVAYLLTHAESLGAQLRRLFFYVEYCYNSAHISFFFGEIKLQKFLFSQTDCR